MTGLWLQHAAGCNATTGARAPIHLTVELCGSAAISTVSCALVSVYSLSSHLPHHHMGAVLITAAAAGLLLVAVFLARKLSSKPIHGLPVAPGAHWLLGNINLFMDYYNASLTWAKTLGQDICVVHPMTGPSLLTTSAAVVEGIFKDRQGV